MDKQKVWLDLQDAVFAFQSLVDRLPEVTFSVCDAMPGQLCAFACVTNPVKPVCYIVAIVTFILEHIILLGLQIAFQAVNQDYEIQTLGPNEAKYAYEYSKATYDGLKEMNKWNYDTLLNINDVIQMQHTSMRQHLQERHLAMER